MPTIALSQVKDSIVKAPASFKPEPYKPEILTSGFIDVVNNGQVNASARFIRLFIGSKARHL